jgi:hypothetical protein
LDRAGPDPKRGIDRKVVQHTRHKKAGYPPAIFVETLDIWAILVSQKGYDFTQTSM